MHDKKEPCASNELSLCKLFQLLIAGDKLIAGLNDQDNALTLALSLSLPLAQSSALRDTEGVRTQTDYASNTYSLERLQSFRFQWK